MIFLTVIKTSRFILLYISIVLLSACNKKGCDIEFGYEFIIPAELSPRQDTFHIGDTIHFVSEFGNMIREKNTGHSYKLVDFNFYPTTSINKIDTVPAFSALDYFELNIEDNYQYSVQRFSSGTVQLNGSYLYNKGNGMYSLKFSLIPKLGGLYSFTHNSSLIHDHGGDQYFEGKCKNETTREILVYLNEGFHNNIDLLRDGVDTAFNNRVLNDPQRKFYEEGAYVFYVVK